MRGGVYNMQLPSSCADHEDRLHVQGNPQTTRNVDGDVVVACATACAAVFTCAVVSACAVANFACAVVTIFACVVVSEVASDLASDFASNFACAVVSVYDSIGVASAYASTGAFISARTSIELVSCT